MAAGRGSRFGGGKLDAPCAGKPVAQWVVEAVAEAGFEAGICITGPQPLALLAQAQSWRSVVNPAPDGGLGGSLAIAARNGSLKLAQGVADAAARNAQLTPPSRLRGHLPEPLAAADEAGLAMLFTGMRHFRH